MEQHERALTLRVQQVSKLLSVPRATIYSWIATGILPSIRIGGVILIAYDDLTAFLAEHRRPARGWSASAPTRRERF